MAQKKRDESKGTKVERGSSNIFADIGVKNADEHMLKAEVALMIGKLIEQKNLNQTDAAKKIGIAQSDVSNILRGKFSGFTLERLLKFARKLGSDIEITVKVSREEREGRLSLMAV